MLKPFSSTLESFSVCLAGYFSIWILVKLEQNESFNINAQSANFK